jgi:hypothetical protein
MSFPAQAAPTERDTLEALANGIREVRVPC